jgi:alkylation response protein AidB-like acyl-CoA dehydrogenase
VDFELSEEQRAYCEAAAQFAREMLAPHAAEWDEKQIFPREVISAAGEMGFCGLYCKPEHGGLGLSRLDSSLIFEQLSMGCTSTTAYLTIHNMASWMVSNWGSEAALEQWAEDLTSGRKLASYCLTEPNAGSDAASLTTRAERDGDTYRITGGKVFISGAGDTELLIVMARTGASGAKGISAFMLPADTPGISFGRKEPKMGWNCQATRSVSFEKVTIPAYYRLADEGMGFTLAMKGLDGGRINIASCSLGTAQQALQQASDYLQERSQFGRKLADFQSPQFKMADMATELIAARQMVRLAASKLDRQDPDSTTYCAMAKRFATDVCFRVVDEALQLFGGYGYIKEYPLERYFRDLRVHRILEGTNEVMRLIIARRLLDGTGRALN